jgi:multidrug efflux pump subunit AcrA (membrane-fusion protein)
VAYRRDPGGGFSAVPVKVGASTAGLVTIVSGLREGDTVALRDPAKAVDELVPTGPSAGGSGSRR